MSIGTGSYTKEKPERYYFTHVIKANINSNGTDLNY